LATAESMPLSIQFVAGREDLFCPRIPRIFANMARVVSADGSFAAIRAIRGQLRFGCGCRVRKYAG
jgi:hypothetical protein